MKKILLFIIILSGVLYSQPQRTVKVEEWIDTNLVQWATIQANADSVLEQNTRWIASRGLIDINTDSVTAISARTLTTIDTTDAHNTRLIALEATSLGSVLEEADTVALVATYYMIDTTAISVLANTVNITTNATNIANLVDSTAQHLARLNEIDDTTGAHNTRLIALESVGIGGKLNNVDFGDSLANYDIVYTSTAWDDTTDERYFEYVPGHGFNNRDGVVKDTVDGTWRVTNCSTRVDAIGRLGLVKSSNYIQKAGILGGYTGLSKGSYYYLTSTDDTWSTAPPTTTNYIKRIGAQAASTTELEINVSLGYGIVQ